MERGKNTFWAPEVVNFNGVYHLFVSYIEGVRTDWGGHARMAHYTSKNMWDWKFEGFVKLSSDKTIDATSSGCPMENGVPGIKMKPVMRLS